MERSVWDAMNSMDKEKEVAWRLMGWTKPKMRLKAGKYEAIIEDGRTVAMRGCLDDEELYPVEDIYWRDPDGRVKGTSEIPCYTTDRNACALVLDAIEKMGIKVRGEVSISYHMIFTNLLVDAVIPEAGQRTYIGRNWDVLRADPDTICYCAVKAVEDAR